MARLARTPTLGCVLAAVLVVGAASVVGAPGALADDLPGGGVASAVAPVFVDPTMRSDAHLYGVEQAERNGGDPAVLSYWTEERTATAIPVEVADLSSEDIAELGRALSSQSDETGPEVASEPAVPIDGVPVPAARASITNWSHTNGKVFFRDPADGKNYVCSGSAVNSGSKRLVATAGHCVYGDAGWFQNWVFVPSYHNGSRPYGTFQAYMLRTFTDFTTHKTSNWRGFNSDVAFVTTYSNASSRRVVEAVGGHGIITGGSEYQFAASIFGYPGNLQSGEVMYACSRTSTEKYSAGGYTFSRVSGCNMGGGSSGGPWLKDYSNASGLGYLKSVSSFNQTGVTYLGAPFFRADVRTLFNNANNDW